MLIETTHETAPTPISAPSLGVVQRLYGCRNGKHVLDFLTSHPVLLPLLEEIHANAADFFAFTSKPILEVITDPEALDSRTLFVFIQTHAGLEDALRQLVRLDEEWWLVASERANGKLCIDVECI